MMTIVEREDSIREEIIIIFFFFYETFAFIRKHNSTKHYLQCKTHYATRLTE